MTIIGRPDDRKDGKLTLTGTYVNKDKSKKTLSEMKQDAINQISSALEKDNHKCKGWRLQVTKCLEVKKEFILYETPE